MGRQVKSGDISNEINTNDRSESHPRVFERAGVKLVVAAERY